MRRSFLGRTIPATLSAATVAVPAVTAARILLHAMSSGSSAATTLPSSSATMPSATSTPGAAPRPIVVPRPTATAVTARTVAGPAVADQFGDVQATITVKGRRITNVSISAPQDDPRSASITQWAVPLLRSETLQAQSASVDLISGATETSSAYLQSLQGALQTAGL